MKTFKILGLLGVSALTLLASSCSSPRTTIKTDDQSGTVQIRVVPSGSLVEVDGTVVGKGYDFSGSAAVLKLAPGKHSIVLRNGEKTCKQDIYLSDTQEVITCNLE